VGAGFGLNAGSDRGADFCGDLGQESFRTYSLSRGHFKKGKRGPFLNWRPLSIGKRPFGVFFCKNGWFFKNIKKRCFSTVKKFRALPCQEKTLGYGCDFVRPKGPIFFWDSLNLHRQYLLQVGAECFQS